MDESKSGMTRRRRVATAPSLEHLEGRRLLTASPTQIGIKEVATSGYNELKIAGTNKADVITINDNGSDATGNVTLTLGDGTTYTSRSAISVIEVAGAGGDDNVTFNLTGTLTAPQSVLISLGAGNNKFTGNIAGAINTSNGLDLEVYGGSGNDTMVVNQTGPTEAGAFVPYLQGGAGKNTMTYNGTGNIAANASVSPEFGGGPGNDRIVSNYSGQIDGNYMYNLSTSAGSGTENISNNVFVGAGSTGTVGASSTSPAAIKAGKGNDTIRFAIAADPSSTAQINAVVVGGSGKDVITRTSNVGLQGKTSRIKDTILS
jgi:hypothetical protein